MLYYCCRSINTHPIYTCSWGDGRLLNACVILHFDQSVCDISEVMCYTYGWHEKVHNCSCCSEVCLCECSTRLLCARDECNHWLGGYWCTVWHRPWQHYLIANWSAPSRRMPTSLCGHLRLTWVATPVDARSMCQDMICLGLLAVLFDSHICGCHACCVLSPWAMFLFWVLGCTICQCVLVCHWL